MAPDTNFKNQDPKKQYNTEENPKDRHGSYDKAQDFDPTDGYDNHPDDQFTSDMVHEEDEFMAKEGHQYRDENESQEGSRTSGNDQSQDEVEYEEDPKRGKAQRTGS